MNTDFSLESFISRFVTKRTRDLLEDDFSLHNDELRSQVEGKRVLVIGGAGTIGSNYAKATLAFNPAALHVVDIDENALTELTRDLRSSGVKVPLEYSTEPLDLGSELFAKYFRAKGPFHIVANFAARKHVRAERDIHSIEAMCQTNLFMARKLLDLLLEQPPEHFFCVSTDKAANPVNVMGATKKLMEETVLAFSQQIPITTARFANVAFSNGSLPLGWLNRISKRQPLSCPLGIRRFFVSPIESGRLCLFASLLGKSGDIFYPKLDPAKDMIPFEEIVRDLLRELGLGCHDCATSEEAKNAMTELSRGWPCEFFPSDTDGEKPYEEFRDATDEVDEKTYSALGVIKNAPRKNTAEIDGVLSALRETFSNPTAEKSDVLQVLCKHLPEFHHLSTGKNLDGRM